MNLEMIARTIQLIIAPAVMITSCCIFGAGLLTHYAGIGERLRLTVRERVDLVREMSDEKGTHVIAKERLEDLDEQIPQLLRHHWLMRTSLVGVLLAMIFYILDMFVIAFSVIANQASLYSLIVVVFLLGVASQLVGVIYTVVDVFMSHRIYAFETRHVLLLEKLEENS